MSKTIANRSKRGTKLISSDEEASLRPSAFQPIRALKMQMTASVQVLPHRHHWAQVVFSDTGVVQVNTPSCAYIVPPRHAVWIPPDVDHAAVLLEHAELFSVYVYVPGEDRQTEHNVWCPRWQHCQVFKVSSLLHALVVSLNELAGAVDQRSRYQAICTLIQAEFDDAKELAIGVVMPEDRRLRALCHSFLNEPSQQKTLKELATQAGASLSTVSRLFQSQLGMSFSQWRQQALLAQAISLAAQKISISRISLELGYATPSAFTAMVTGLVGIPPKKLFYGFSEARSDTEAYPTEG